MDKFVVKTVKKIPETENLPTASAPSTADSDRRREDEASLPQAVGIDSIKSVSVGSKNTQNKRRYNPEWRKTYPWIQYNEERDHLTCSVCKRVHEEKGYSLSKSVSKLDPAFIEKGFSNWKNAIEKLKKHESSTCHRVAVVKMSSMDAGVNVHAQISDDKLKQMESSRSCLLKLLSSLRYLATQGLAIRGHTEECSNFMNLLLLRCEDDPALKNWLSKEKTESYTWTSPKIQNEMLDMMSHALLRKLLLEVKEACFFAIICDETADVSRKEQFSVSLRFVTELLSIEELFFGFYQTDSTDAETLFKIIKDVLHRFDLPVSDCRGQCFDGAANMSGVYNGVQAKILNLEGKALFVHCLAHSLNLVVQDLLKNIPKCRDTLNTVKDIINFVRDSPKRLAIFQSMKLENQSPNLKPLCPTRWTVKYASFSSILANYATLVEFFNEIANEDSSDAGAKCSGLLRVMESFDFFFTLTVLTKLFGQIDSVNSALQKKSLHLEQAHRMVETLKACITLSKDDFGDIWSKVNTSRPEEVHSPVLPRKRKVPKKIDCSKDSSIEQYSSIEQKYRALYIEIIDVTKKGIETRFETNSHEFMRKVENFLIGDDSKKEEILEFYSKDIDSDRFLIHRDLFFKILKEGGKSVDNTEDVVEFLKSNPYLKDLIPEFYKFIRIFLTLPVSTATAERSFSGLKRLKTYLRATMLQQRLNSLGVLNFHRDAANKLDLDDIADEFISKNDIRKKKFTLKLMKGKA